MRKAWPRARAGLQTEGGDPSGGGRDARCRTRALWGVKEQEKDGERFCPGVELGGEQPSGWETLEGAQTQGESSPSTLRHLNETPCHGVCGRHLTELCGHNRGPSGRGQEKPLWPEDSLSVPLKT